jgi:LemA protein
MKRWLAAVKRRKDMLQLLAMDPGTIITLVIVGIVVILVIAIVAWYISTRNKFVRLKNKVEEAWASIDVYLKKRFDLIPNLVETVKGYAKHESETLEKVVAARNIAAGAKSAEEKIAASANLTSSLKTFFNVVSESYPELKANTNFLDLQNQLKGLETNLENARLYYNGQVKTFNTEIELFPGNLVVKGMGEDYKKRPYYEIENEEERQNVKVSF